MGSERQCEVKERKWKVKVGQWKVYVEAKVVKERQLHRRHAISTEVAQREGSNDRSSERAATTEAARGQQRQKDSRPGRPPCCRPAPRSPAAAALEGAPRHRRDGQPCLTGLRVISLVRPVGRGGEARTDSGAQRKKEGPKLEHLFAHSTEEIPKRRRAIRKRFVDGPGTTSIRGGAGAGVVRVAGSCSTGGGGCGGPGRKNTTQEDGSMGQCRRMDQWGGRSFMGCGENTGAGGEKAVERQWKYKDRRYVDGYTGG